MISYHPEWVLNLCNQLEWRKNSNRQWRAVTVQAVYHAIVWTACNKPQATGTPSPENNTYRLLHAGKTCEMTNKAFHLHQQASPNCRTNLQFDFDAEQQRRVCWKETLRCMYCTYRTESTKLFEEVETGLRGLNAGKPNLSVWAALLDNLIKGTTLKYVFMVLNCPAPSYSGLQCNANKVGPLIVDMVREDLKRERTLLIYVLESYGFPRQILIPMEGDGRYNNPLHWPRDRDPFQPATQST